MMAQPTVIRLLPRIEDLKAPVTPYPSTTPFVDRPEPPRTLLADREALAFDYYCWLEDDLGLPVSQKYAAEDRNLFLHGRPPALLPEVHYTVEDVERLYGFEANEFRIKQGIHMPRLGGRAGALSGTDLTPVYHWAEDRWFRATMRAFFQRFVFPCGTCASCTKKNFIKCSKFSHVGKARYAFNGFLEKVRGFESVDAWWASPETKSWSEKFEATTSYAPGFVLLWLHHRGFLDLSLEELYCVVDVSRDHSRMIAGSGSWRGVPRDLYWRYTERQIGHPGFFGAIAEQTKARSARSRTDYSLRVLAALLLRNRVKSLSELLRPLSDEEMTRAQREFRFMRMPLACGAFYPTSSGSDLRWGHLLLDSARFWIWEYGAACPRTKTWDRKQIYSYGPGNLQIGDVRRLEVALARPWGRVEQILPKRAETIYKSTNLFVWYQRARKKGLAAECFPECVQTALRAWIYTAAPNTLPLRETSLARNYGVVMHWLRWVQRHSQLRMEAWGQWSREQLYDAIDRYLRVIEDRAPKRLFDVLHALRVFFSAIEPMGITKPADLSVVHLFKADRHAGNVVPPPIEVVDRIFGDGVCKLNWDWRAKRARLLLTLCYCLGVRPGEAANFHLECLKLGKDGVTPCWWVPPFKGHKERFWPLMEIFEQEKLLDFYVEWRDHLRQTFHICPRCSHQWDATGMPADSDDTDVCPCCGVKDVPQLRFVYHRDPGVNPRYRRFNRDLAENWHYLFAEPLDDRAEATAKLGARHGAFWLQRALYLAARTNPDGLFRTETWQPTCRYKVAPGRECGFFAWRDGLYQCPICAKEMGGKRGEICRRRLEHGFECIGAAANNELFCPKCHQPLATFVEMSPNLFRHNSVDRFRQTVGNDDLSAELHGHTKNIARASYSNIDAGEIARVLQTALANPSAPVSVFAGAGGQPTGGAAEVLEF
jgi:hypothetical protein